MHTIKKYPNRRLYDQSASRYISSADLLELLRASEEVRVTDAQSGQDITRTVLCNLLGEQALSHPVSLLSAELLGQALRVDEVALSGLCGRYLERAAAGFLAEGPWLLAQLRDFDGVSPQTLLAELEAAQREVFARFKAARGESPPI